MPSIQIVDELKRDRKLRGKDNLAWFDYVEPTNDGNLIKIDVNRRVLFVTMLLSLDMHIPETQEWGGVLASRLLITLELLTVALVFLWLGLDAVRKRVFRTRESLEGQGVLITNGETALATALAQQLTAEGCKVALVLPPGALEHSAPPGVHALHAAAGTRAAAAALVGEARALLGPVRVLVLAPPGPTVGGLSGMARAVDGDVLDNLHLAEQAVAPMAEEEGGRVLAVALARGDAYDGARAALADVVRAAAQHVADSTCGGTSVRVSSVRVRSGVDSERAAAALVAAIRDSRPRMLLPSTRAHYAHLARMAMNKVKQSFVKAVWRRIKMLA